MTFNPEQIAALEAPLSTANVKSRVQAGQTLSYIEAWRAIAEANRIFGFDAWNRETVEMRLLGEPRMVGDKYRVGYFAKVRITVGDITRDGCGFGQGIDKDPDQAHESALKEAESDAMKRALMTFGNPFGLALYDKTQANVSDAAQPPAEPPEPPEQATAVLAANLAISLCKTSSELRAWWEEHKAQINSLPDPQYLLVSATMRAKTAELKPKAVAHG